MHDDVKRLIRSNFFAFAMKSFAYLNAGRSMEPYPFLKALAGFLQAFAETPGARCVLNMPPRHFKTFFGTICLTAWILARDPSAKVLVLSYSGEHARNIADAIRQIIRSPWYQGIFEGTVLRKKKVDHLITTAGGSVHSLSLDGAVTGLGADFIIVDDPLQIKHFDNTPRLQQVNAIFDQQVRSRLNSPKKGHILIVAHRISPNDLSGHVLKARGWKGFALPLVADREQKIIQADGSVWLRKRGTVLMPDAFSSQRIAELDSEGGPGFDTLYQQRPERWLAGRLATEDFPLFTPAEPPHEPEPAIIISIDPGLVGGIHNDFSVIQVWRAFRDNYFLLDQWREQANFAEFQAQARRMIKMWFPAVVLVENTGFGPALLSTLRPHADRQDIAVTVTENKRHRLLRNRHLIRAGRVKLPQNAPWLGEFLSEVTAFPYVPFNDQVDTMTLFLDYVARNPNPPRRAGRSSGVNVSLYSQGFSSGWPGRSGDGQTQPGPSDFPGLALHSWYRRRY
jgi:predicted phage terminase large subunit-like protein